MNSSPNLPRAVSADLPPDPEAFSERKQLIHAAIAVYMDDPASLTPAAICEQAGTDRLTFVSYFDEPEDALPAFYTLVFDQYHLLRMATDGYEHFSFEERLATFLYILLDALDEEREFVKATFHSDIRRSASFRDQVQGEMQRLLTEDTVPSTNQWVTGRWTVSRIATEAVLRIIRFWLHDTSDDRAATTALIDKLVAFTAELVTFRGVQRGTDLLWYLTKVDALGLKRVPLIGRFFE